MEVNSETDFVASNDEFINFVEDILDSAIEAGVNDADSLKSAPSKGSDKKIEEALTEKIAKIGENLNPRRVASLEVSNGVVAKYVHNAKNANLGTIVALVALESDVSDKQALENVGLQVAMHIVVLLSQML